FVDIGVKQDGLVHVSQMANKFVSDPNEVVKLNQKVMVTVTEVDVTRKRIALTMKEEGNQKSEVRSTKYEAKGQRSEKKTFAKKQEPLNPFQSKLMELKKKFDN
ncbi:MAG TPA: S1 RNA-binding domain-containing protein, partial [Flavisolibacter sp.]|nr:S1 RNA-binding domain-containing protein [Flavisolibacter sp.]